MIILYEIHEWHEVPRFGPSFLLTQEILFSSLSLKSQEMWLFSTTSVGISYRAPLSVYLAAKYWMGGKVVNDELGVAMA